MIKVSVIVPVYNVREYLERCVDSIINQSVKEIEIILVDDGSTDGSGDLCETLAKKDHRIKVIHQENQGLGPARNSGLDVAKGQYVSFIDSDDWIELNTYEILLDIIGKNECQIVTCGRKIVDDNGCVTKVYCNDSEKILFNEEIIEHYLLQLDMNMSACDKLFYRRLFSDIRFPENYVSEDYVPIYNALKKVNKIVLSGKPLYNYYYRSGSLSRTPTFTNKRMGQLIYATMVSNDVKQLYPSLIEQANYYEYDALISTWRSIVRSNYHGEERYSVKNIFKKQRWKMLCNKYMHSKQRIYVLLMILRIEHIVECFFLLTIFISYN